MTCSRTIFGAHASWIELACYNQPRYVTVSVLRSHLCFDTDGWVSGKLSGARKKARFNKSVEVHSRIKGEKGGLGSPGKSIKYST